MNALLDKCFAPARLNGLTLKNNHWPPTLENTLMRKCCRALRLNIHRWPPHKAKLTVSVGNWPNIVAIKFPV